MQYHPAGRNDPRQKPTDRLPGKVGPKSHIDIKRLLTVGRVGRGESQPKGSTFLFVIMHFNPAVLVRACLVSVCFFHVRGCFIVVSHRLKPYRLAGGYFVRLNYKALYRT